MSAVIEDIKYLFVKDNIVATFSAIAIFISFSPYFTWHFPISVAGLATLTLFLLNIRNCKRRTNPWIYLFTGLYIILAIRGNYSLFGFILLLLLCIFFYLDDNYCQKLYKSFIIIFSVLCSVSFTVYFCAVILELPVPSTPIDPLYDTKTEAGISYYSYPFLVVSESVIKLLRYRFCGYFDEPGVIGTIVGSCLLINRFDFKKWYNVLLFIFGLFTMSLYFYFMVLFYYLLVARTKAKILIFLSLGILFFLLRDNEIVSTLILDRLSFDEGLSSINNRDHMSTTWWNNFVQSDVFWVGLGSGTSNIVNDGGSSYKDIIIDHGFIFFILYIVIYFLMAKSMIKNMKQTLFCFIIFFSVLFQRPYIDACGYVFLMFIPIVIIANQIKKNEKKYSHSYGNL